MFTQAASHNRFNLLLLSEGEHYFSDYSAIFYPNCATDVEAVSKYDLLTFSIFPLPIATFVPLLTLSSFSVVFLDR